MLHSWQIVNNEEEFSVWWETIDKTKPIAIDTETKGQRPVMGEPNLLGIAITGYTVLAGGYSSAFLRPGHISRTAVSNLFSYSVVGWNVPFDKAWLDHTFSINTEWHADGRIMWHLQNNDPTIRGFGLKKAQKLLLGWLESNDAELEQNVLGKGGKLANGDHYLADLEVLAKYACLDTYSTLLCYEKLSPFFDDNDYWGFQKEILDYACLLGRAAQQGLPVEESELMRAAALYEQKREKSKLTIREACSEEIKAIEHTWLVKQSSTYKTEKGKDSFVRSVLRHRRFNPSSTHQRALLLHTMLEFPVRETTPTGIPKTDRANISLIKHEAASTLVSYSEYKKIAEQARTYLAAVKDGRMFTNYDVCGTVSGRLSGFKPSVLNMPFSEPEVMSAFKCDDGFIGVHADLASIEPCVLAHYSEDPTLLKVYRAGLGDIYLDLALDMFPENNELREGYNPNVPITSEVKERFKDLRAICKTIHLAVSYTGTYITVAKNLSKNGYPTTKGQAMDLVKRYWSKFQRVKAFNARLQDIYQTKGPIRNLTGRIIQVPSGYVKDLMNRLVQSGAHDILRLWVMQIIREFNNEGIQWRYWLTDLHDSTTFMVVAADVERAKSCYERALGIIEKEVNLSVPLKMELKFCRTLAGLKGHE